MSNKLFTVVLVLLVVVLGATAAYQYKKITDLKKNPQAAQQEEVKAIIAKVSKLILLPTDEEPTIATVSDPAALKDQPFFANAKQGDKVLIYTNARKAILYDPVGNKIIEVAPVNIGNNTGTQTQPAAKTTTTTTKTQ